MLKSLSDIFNEFTQAPSRPEKIASLRRNHSIQLECVLRGTFHPAIKYTVDKIPPYKTTPAPDGFGYSSIIQEMGRIYIFEANNPKRPNNLSKKRETEILIQMLEGMDGDEAKLFGGMLTKNLNVPGLDYKIVKEAFPGLLP